MKFTAPKNQRLRILRVIALMAIVYVALYPFFKYMVTIKAAVPTTGEYWTFYLLGGVLIFCFALLYNYCSSIEIDFNKKCIVLIRRNIVNRIKVLEISFSELDYRIIETDRWKKIILYRNGKKVGQFWSNDISEEAYVAVKESFNQMKKQRES